jgi:rhamnulose-1-phosphate aldolase
MPVNEPYPSLEEIVESIGDAGRRLSEIEASEGAAGNISVFIGWPVDVRTAFPLEETLLLPQPVPALAGGVLLVTGAGRRLREIKDEPSANLGCVAVGAGGVSAGLLTSPRRLFPRLTSEFNSHLAVHHDQVHRTRSNFQAVVHAQPLHLTFLSHVPGYRDEARLNPRLLRWQPEAIVNLPEGLGVVPFRVPGAPELVELTVAALRDHRLAVWAKHGVIARSDRSVKRAVDRIEYAETAARYEYMDLLAGGKADGLTPDEIKAVCRSLGIEQDIF